MRAQDAGFVFTGYEFADEKVWGLVRSCMFRQL